MTFVIAEPCIDVKDGACVEVCPADCIETAENSAQYYIDPERCIDCDLCVTVCPVDAICKQEALPERWRHFSDVNEKFFVARGNS